MRHDAEVGRRRVRDGPLLDERGRALRKRRQRMLNRIGWDGYRLLWRIVRRVGLWVGVLMKGMLVGEGWVDCLDL